MWADYSNVDVAATQWRPNAKAETPNHDLHYILCKIDSILERHRIEDDWQFWNVVIDPSLENIRVRSSIYQFG